MNTIGVGEVAEPVVPMNILMLQDEIIKRVVFHVFEIQQISDHEKWDKLNAMLQIVCKKFNKVVFVYNRTPRYALAENYNTACDIVADFKDSHLAKMLRELDLMHYWDHFKKSKQSMYFFAVNLKTLSKDLSPYVRNSEHRALIVQYIAHEARIHGRR